MSFRCPPEVRTPPSVARRPSPDASAAPAPATQYRERHSYNRHAIDRKKNPHDQEIRNTK